MSNWAKEFLKQTVTPEMNNPFSLESFEDDEAADGDVVGGEPWTPKEDDVVLPTLSDESPLLNSQLADQLEESMVDLQSWVDIGNHLKNANGVSKHDAVKIKQRLTNNRISLESNNPFSNETVENRFTSNPTQVNYTEALNTVYAAQGQLADKMIQEQYNTWLTLKTEFDNQQVAEMVENTKVLINKIIAFNHLAKSHDFNVDGMDKLLSVKAVDDHQVGEVFSNIFKGQSVICSELLNLNGTHHVEFFKHLSEQNPYIWDNELESFLQRVTNKQGQGDVEFSLKISTLGFDHQRVHDRLLAILNKYNECRTNLAELKLDSLDAFREQQYPNGFDNPETIREKNQIAVYHQNIMHLMEFVTKHYEYIYQNLRNILKDMVSGIADQYVQNEKVIPEVLSKMGLILS